MGGGVGPAIERDCSVFSRRWSKFVIMRKRSWIDADDILYSIYFYCVGCGGDSATFEVVAAQRVPPNFLLLPYALLVPVISSLVTLLMISLPLFYPFYQLAVIIVTIFLLYKLRGLFKDGLQEQSDGRYFLTFGRLGVYILTLVIGTITVVQNLMAM